MTYFIKLASAEDVADIAKITNEEARRSTATVASSSEPIAEWITSFQNDLDKAPWLVAMAPLRSRVAEEREYEVIGYAKGSQYNSRDGFKWSMALSIYIKPEWKGKKVGENLYSVLFQLMKTQGVHNVYARIALPNPASQRLHSRFGLIQTGLLPKFAWKFGTWHDMAIYTGCIGSTAEASPSDLVGVKEAWDKNFGEVHLAFEELLPSLPASEASSVLSYGEDR